MSTDSSNLLIDCYPLMVLPPLAVAIGLNEAIVLQQLHYWVGISKKSNDESKFVNGCWWTYNTYEDWHNNFPFWSIPTIQRIIYSLEKKGLIISDRMRLNKWDNTKWYRIDYEKLNDFINLMNLRSLERSDQDHPDDELLIPETSTEISTETNLTPVQNDEVNERSNNSNDATDAAIKAIEEVAVKYPPQAKANGRNGTNHALENGYAQDFALKEEYEKTTHTTPNWALKGYRDFLMWLKERPQGQTVTVFAHWWYDNDWRGKQGQPPTIYQVQELWPQAFQPVRRDPRNLGVEVF